MSNISATTTIDTIIKDFQHISGRTEAKSNEYNKLLTLCVRALQDIRQFHASTVVSTKEYNLNNLTNGVLAYPSDCLGIIGVFYNEGDALFPARQRDDIIYTTGDSGSVSSVEDINDYYTNVDYYANHYRVYTNYGAAGGRNRFYYTDDKESRRLIFDATADEDIWLKYVSTGVDGTLGEDTIVPKEYVETIEAYMQWQEALKDIRLIKFAETYRRAYKQAARRLRAFQSPTIEEWKDVLYSTFKQGVKR